MTRADSQREPLDTRCRNCGADAPGNYCAECGQETRIPLPKVGELVRDAAGRLVAWDSRLWRTLAALAWRPGALTREYLAGRRRRYVRPARLFLVLSLLVFAVLGLLRSPTFVADDIMFRSGDELGSGPAGAQGPKPVTAQDAAPAAADAKAAKPDAEEPMILFEADADNVISIDPKMNLRIQLRGIERELPAEIRKRYERFQRMSKEDRLEHVYAGMMRYGPYMVVLMLPVFALLLKLAYLGSGRRYPARPQRYAEHLVYSAHMHAFAALVVVLWLLPQPGWTRLLLGGWAVYYAVRARTVVYGGRLWAGLLRSVAVGVVYAAIGLVALAGLVVAAAMLR